MVAEQDSLDLFKLALGNMEPRVVVIENSAAKFSFVGSSEN